MDFNSSLKDLLFLSRLLAHALCLAQLYCTPVYALLYHGLSRDFESKLILTNKSNRNLTSTSAQTQEQTWK